MLRNVVAIVSGGASGLGAATASAIIRHNGRVVVADLPYKRDEFLRLAAASCASAAVSGEIADGVSCEVTAAANRKRSAADGPIMAFAETDVTDEDQVSAALDLAEEKFGKSGVSLGTSLLQLILQVGH